MQNFNDFRGKSYWNILIAGGTSPADFSTAGTRPPSPVFGAHGYDPSDWTLKTNENRSFQT